MEATRESLKERYQVMDTDELIRILDEGNLNELAKGVMQEELKNRELSSSDNIEQAREHAYAPEPFKEDGLELTESEIIFQGRRLLLSDVVQAGTYRYRKWGSIIGGLLGLILTNPIINKVASVLDPQSSKTMELTTMDHIAGVSIAVLSLVFLLVIIYGIAGGKGTKVTMTSSEKVKIPVKNSGNCNALTRTIENYIALHNV